MTYAVQALSVAPASLNLERQTLNCVERTSKPKIVAMAANGDVAIVFPTDPVYGTGARSILLLRPDGSRVRLPLPSDERLAHSFRMYQVESGKPKFQDVFFGSVRLADDGTPLATVVSHFSGAYSGLESAVFRWSGGAWTQVPPRNAATPATFGWSVNTQIAAAETSTGAALNVVYGQQFSPDLAHLNDPLYMLDQVEVVDNGRVTVLGAGTATSIRGGVVSGFQAGLNPFGPSCEQPRKSYAVVWVNGKVRRLGPGVAYDRNAKGESVGDDEVLFGMRGRPVVWSRGKTIVLSRKMGTAYAISPDGTVVGRVGDSAFATNVKQPSKIATLDDCISDRGWHVVAAFSVDNRGRILALGHRTGQPLQIIVLQPLLRAQAYPSP